MLCRGQKPPASGNTAVLAILNRLMPASLSRSVLSKGVQHPSPLVQYTTLSTLLKVLQSSHSMQQDLQAAASIVRTKTDLKFDSAAATAQAVTPPLLSSDSKNKSNPLLGKEQLTTDDYLSQYAASVAAALEQTQQHQSLVSSDEASHREPNLASEWQSFSDQFQQAFRARLPDVQSLLALLATLQKRKGALPVNHTAGTAGIAGTVGAAGTAGTAGTSGTAGMSGKAGTAGTASKMDGSTAAKDLPDSYSDSDSPDNIAQHQLSLPEALQKDTQDGAPPMTASELTSTLLFMVLQNYQECLPEAMSDSRIDIPSLMTQVCLQAQTKCHMRKFGLIFHLPECLSQHMPGCFILQLDDNDRS